MAARLTKNTVAEVPARKRGPRRATQPLRLGRILRGSLALAPQDDGSANAVRMEVNGPGMTGSHRPAA
jgi:hypothetical protein